MIRHSVFNRLLAVAVLTGAAGMVQGQVLSAFQVNNRYDRPVGKEGSPQKGGKSARRTRSRRGNEPCRGPGPAGRSPRRAGHRLTAKAAKQDPEPH